ncbi:MAG: hypothetical protein NDI80_01700 [Flavobacteriaceae bacterium]|nr:hypothetical protein [Flavobacteriaceae bacterium]
MKLINYFFALFLFLNVLASCTVDDQEEEMLTAPTQEVIATGDNGTGTVDKIKP